MREKCFAEEINKSPQWCSNGVIELLRSLVLLELLYTFYPLRFLSTNRIARFPSMVKMRKGREPHLLSKSDTWWLAHEKNKDSHKCVRWTEKVLFKQALKL